METTKNSNLYKVQNLNFAYGNNVIFDDFNMEMKKGIVTTFLGANGCGKSTLFGILTKNLKPSNGIITFRGEDLEKMKLKNFAKEVAIVHQKNTAPGDITVKKLVSYGRTPHKVLGALKRDDKDEEKINWALDVTNLSEFKDRAISQLSGGQMQRVWIAMALAQETEVLFLDEPTTFLDIKYQLDILKLVRKLNKEHKMTVVMVLHDINQALSYSDEIIALRSGKIIAQGNPSEIVNGGLLKDVYGVELNIIEAEGQFCVVPV